MNQPAHAAESIANEGCRLPAEVVLHAGMYLPTAETWNPFASAALDFLNTFSREIKKCGRHLKSPEVMALAFWCRRSHILLLRKKHAGIELMTRLGRGRIFHLAPANVPLMFFYTYAIGLLAGNAGIIRISGRTLRMESTQAVLKVLRILYKRKEFSAICSRSCFISYERSDALTEKILRSCDGRVLWGGDETILRMRRIPMPAHAVELTFPDRVSLAVIDEDALEKMEEERVRNLVHRFYNDTYAMDQNGCSSPQTVIWLKKSVPDESGMLRNDPATGDRPDAASESGTQAASFVRKKWWEMLAKEAEASYEIDGFRAARKLERALLTAMRPVGSDDTAAGESATFRYNRGNWLYVLHLPALPADLSGYKGGFGLFYETETDSVEKIFNSFSQRIQTVVCIGISPEILSSQAIAQHVPGALRFVHPGEALQMDTVWDGTDMIAALSRRM